jgi:hypothetical protein
MSGQRLPSAPQSTVVRVVAILAILVLVTLGVWLWSSSRPEASPLVSGESSHSPDGTAAPTVVDVLCDANFTLRVSSDTVAATASGVAVRVTSEAPEGAYLNFGLGGDPMPASPETWMLAAPAGELQLSCSTLEHEGAVVNVIVVDPDHHWSDQTLDGLGCPVRGIPSWVVSGGTGATPEDAVAQLIANFTEHGASPTLTRYEYAQIGYLDTSNQTWIIGTADATHMTAVVTESGAEYQASPEVLCVASPWTAAANT